MFVEDSEDLTIAALINKKNDKTIYLKLNF